jgi:hypothetical protein
MERVSDIIRQKSSPPPFREPGQKRPLNGSKAEREATEPELICDEDPAPWKRYKPGEYELRCTSYEFVRVKMFGLQWKLRLMFRFMDMETRGRIAKFFHMGNGAKPKAGRKSEYFRAWVIANDGRLPRKGCPMSPRAFAGHVFRAEVRDVTRTMDPKINHSPEAVYSVVDKILELRA